MSKIYKLIEDQINNFIHVAMEDENGQIQYGGKWIKYAWVKTVVQLVATLIFLFIALFFGVYLWNYGIHPVMPNIIARIDGANPMQSSSPYVQLILTLFAFMMFF